MVYSSKKKATNELFDSWFKLQCDEVVLLSLLQTIYIEIVLILLRVQLLYYKLWTSIDLLHYYFKQIRLKQNVSENVYPKIIQNGFVSKVLNIKH